MSPIQKSKMSRLQAGDSDRVLRRLFFALEAYVGPLYGVVEYFHLVDLKWGHAASLQSKFMTQDV